jgi:hypothetical protein
MTDRAAPAAPDDVAYLVSYLRAMIDDESERTRRGEGETLELNAAADMLESLATRNRALEGENVRLQHIYESMLSQVDELKGAIEEHNKRMLRECAEGKCLDHDGYGCNSCPARYMIEVPK